MESTQPELTLLHWFGQINYATMGWIHAYWWPAWAGLIFTACLIGMAPLATHHTQPFYQLVLVWLRKTIVWAGVILMVLPFVTLYVYDMTLQHPLVNPQQVWLNWFVHLAQQKWPLVLAAAVSGWTLRFMFKRYVLPAGSGWLRQHRNPQTVEMLSDIRDESLRFKEKSFVPSKYYRKEAMVIGLDEKNQPIVIPSDCLASITMSGFATIMMAG